MATCISSSLPLFTEFNVNLIESQLLDIISKLKTDFKYLESKIENEDDPNKYYYLTIDEREKIEEIERQKKEQEEEKRRKRKRLIKRNKHNYLA